jgi:hypothetical protein
MLKYFHVTSFIPTRTFQIFVSVILLQWPMFSFLSSGYFVIYTVLWGINLSVRKYVRKNGSLCPKLYYSGDFKERGQDESQLETQYWRLLLLAPPQAVLLADVTFPHLGRCHIRKGSLLGWYAINYANVEGKWWENSMLKRGYSSSSCYLLSLTVLNKQSFWVAMISKGFSSGAFGSLCPFLRGEKSRN